jgi:hypothetical protein
MKFVRRKRIQSQGSTIRRVVEMKDTLSYVDEIVCLSECKNVGVLTPMNDVLVFV